MDHYTLGLIAAAIGGLFAIIGRYLTSWFSAESSDKVSLRESMLKRIDQLEGRQTKLERRLAETEEKMHRWILRYWSLYRWTVKNRDKTGIIPPNFHDMANEELEGKSKK